MNSNVNCPQLNLGLVGASENGGIRINGLVTVSVGVTCEPGTSNAYCCRIGSVEFTWIGLSLGSPPPTPLGSNYAIYTDPMNHTTTSICPGESGAYAKITWIPSIAVVGSVSSSAPAIGYISAGITCLNSQCTDFCPATAPGDYTGSIASSSHINVLPAKGSGQSLEAMTLLKQAVAPDVTLIGFGVGSFRQPTRLRARALKSEGFGDFVVPRVMVSMVEPRDVQKDRGYHSGVLVPGIHFARDVKLASSNELVVDAGAQGVLEVQWPAHSLGRRAMIEVSQELDGEVKGSFVLGLRHVPVGHDGLVWL
jgi:hypothetical protein